MSRRSARATAAPIPSRAPNASAFFPSICTLSTHSLRTLYFTHSLHVTSLVSPEYLLYKYTHSLHTLSPHTLSTHSLHTLSPHTLSTHSLHTLSPHTLSTHSLHTLSPHTLYTHSLHTLSTRTLYTHSLHTLSPRTLYTRSSTLKSSGRCTFRSRSSRG